MPKGYWIVRVDIADQEKKAYIAANAGPFRSTVPASSCAPAASRLRREPVVCVMR